jgi:ferritin-like metal-binding protein YciE
MAKAKTFRNLFIDQLRDLYSAETQLIKALPKMAEAATSPALKDAFRGHLAETKEHLERLEELFQTFDEKPTGKICAAMKGIISEGDEIANEKYTLPVRDAGLIAAAQRVEHYEMAAYGTVRAFALRLHDKSIVAKLQLTLKEEGDCDKKLTLLAHSSINERASEEQDQLANA